MTARRPNRLARETSPYLLQHAHNPVDWYPWGPEALARAKDEDKPILLSIGYSACHWCHVMERESFEDEATAQLMNERFVSIKVDREERPDLDRIYQLAVQLMGRSGGWPLTALLLPDGRPFFAGTYFPNEDRFGTPSFRRVLEAAVEAYRERREGVEERAAELTRALAEREGALARPKSDAALSGSRVLASAVEALSSRFDDIHGGFGDRPKFPNPSCVDLLLRTGIEESDGAALGRARLALDQMRRGGIFDQLGGGFHRYSTDERWLVPHFEKMLYDNAQLLRLYADGLRIFGDDRYAQTASDIGTYLLREMQSDEGGFFASQDADSEGEEGKFFVWSRGEIEQVLAHDALARDVALRHFGVSEEGNFEGTGKSVLAEALALERVSEELGRPLGEVVSAYERAVRGLLAARERRPRPSRDDKVLASWNGLVISALADASTVLGEPALLASAEKAFDDVERRAVRGGRVSRLCRSGGPKGDGFLEDHAFLCLAALELFEITGSARRLALAGKLADEILARFWVPERTTFLLAGRDAPALVVTPHDALDQAVPSGASAAALALLKLGAILDDSYARPAAQYLELMATAAEENPFAFAATLASHDRLVRGSTDVVILGELDHPEARALCAAAFGAYVPNRNIVRADPSDPSSFRAARLLVEGKAYDGYPVAYVCRNRTCSLPARTQDELRDALGAD